MDRGRQHWTSSWLVSRSFHSVQSIEPWCQSSSIETTTATDSNYTTKTTRLTYKQRFLPSNYYSIGSIFNKIRPNPNVSSLRRRMVAAQRALNRATKTLAALPRIKQQRQTFLQQPQKLVKFLFLYKSNLFFHFRETSWHEIDLAVVVGVVSVKGNIPKTFSEQTKNVYFSHF